MRPLKPRAFVMPVVALAVCLLMACGAGHMYISDEADLAFYQRVGVIPFANFASDRNAAEKVTSTFTNELLMMQSLAVINQGDLNGVISTSVTRDITNAMEDFTAEEFAAIGEAAGVEGVFVGAVKDFSMVRSGQEEFPLVALVVRFVDCPTGRVVWSYEVSRKGGPKFPIFSFGETHTLGEMTSKTCHEIAQSFGRLVR